MTTLTAAEHATLADRCADALDGHFDQHVWEAMHHHGGESVLAFQREAEAAAVNKATAPIRRRGRNDDPMGIGAALRALRR